MSSDLVQPSRRKREVFNPLRRGGACSRCRKAKLRCDGFKPSCTRCKSTGEERDCSYADVGAVRQRKDEEVNRACSSGMEMDAAGTVLPLYQDGLGPIDYRGAVDKDGPFHDGNLSTNQYAMSDYAQAFPFQAIHHNQLESSGPSSSSHSPMETSHPANPSQYAPTTDPLQASLLTPNTQILLQQFLDLPTSPIEQTLNFTQQAIPGTLSELALYPYHSGSALQNAPGESYRNPSESVMPMYQVPALLPTGLNLLGPLPLTNNGFPGAEMHHFLSALDGDAAGYHFSLPLNLPKPEILSMVPEPPPEPHTVPPPSDPYPTGLPDYSNSGWHPLTEPGKTPIAKEPIDVPPFVRDKLLRTYFENLARLPCRYIDKDRLYRRLEVGGGDRPHPAWLFSMYLDGSLWTQDPSLRNMEDHFFKVAKESFELGLTRLDRCLDLVRAALNLAVYLIQRDREAESFTVSMQAISLAKACGLHVGRYKRGSQPHRPQSDGGALRRMMCRLDVPEDDDGVRERLDVWGTVQALDTFGVMVSGRPPSIEDHSATPVQFFSEGDSGSMQHFVTLQDLFDGQPVDIHGEKPSGAPTKMAIALLAYVFNLTFLPRKNIGKQHHLAKVAVDALVAAFPPEWHDIRNFVDGSPMQETVVPERYSLLALWCTIHMINAYICEIEPTLTDKRPVDHAKRMIQYLPIIQGKISSMPMHMTIYLEFCAKALIEEAGRLRSSGLNQAAYSLERLAEVTMATMAKVARVYNLQ